MSTGHGAAAVLCSWEGNRRSGVALAVRHRLCGISTCGLNGLTKRDEQLAYTPLPSMTSFTFTRGLVHAD